MSENKQKFSYSEKQYMLKIISFLDSLVIKSTFDASLTETTESKIAGDLYVLAKNNKDTLFDYTLTYDALVEIKIGSDLENLFITDKSQFYTALTQEATDKIVAYYRAKTIKNYVEKNPYYLTLNGEPTSSDEIVLVEDIYEGGSWPIHMYSETYHPKMYAYLMNFNMQKFNSILAEQRAAGKDFEYFNHIFCKVPYHQSRAARNFDILYSNVSILSSRDTHNFYTCYYQAQDYVMTVPYIPELAKSEELYDRYMGVVVLFIGTLNFITTRIETYMRNEYATNEDKRTFFSEHNMEKLVEELTEEQLNTLIQNMDKLIPLKGSDEVITKVLELFGITNIDIYKYVLLKHINADTISKDAIVDPRKPRSENYNLKLVKVPVEDTKTSKSLSRYLSDKSQHIDFRTIALKDVYFGGSHFSTSDVASNPKVQLIKEIEDKLKNNEEFSYLYTKYIGILSHVNITQSMVESTYFFDAVMHDSEILDTELAFSSVSETVTFRDLFAALNYITTLRAGMSDEIIKSTSAIASIMGFNTNPNLDELRNMSEFVIPITDADDGTQYEIRLPKVIDDSEIFIVKTSGTATDPNDEYRNNFNGINAYLYNMDKHDQLVDKMYRCTDYKEYLGYKKIFNYNMYCKAAADLFPNATTYLGYLMANVPKLYEYIITYINSQTDSIWETEKGEYTESFRNACINLVAEIVDAMLLKLNVSQELQNSVGSTYKDNASTFSKIFAVINIFKSYTTEFCNVETSYTIDNNRDCLVKVLDLLTYRDSSSTYKEALYELINHKLSIHMNTDVVDSIKIREHLKEYLNYDITEVISIKDVFEYLHTLTIDEHLSIHDTATQTRTDNVSDKVIVRDTFKTLIVEDHTLQSPLTVTDKLDLSQITPGNTGKTSISITDQLVDVTE